MLLNFLVDCKDCGVRPCFVPSLQAHDPLRGWFLLVLYQTMMNEMVMVLTKRNEIIYSMSPGYSEAIPMMDRCHRLSAPTDRAEASIPCQYQSL